MNPTAIAPVSPDGEPRPFWSVMMPAYQPEAAHLRQALESVLQQDPGPEQMQIEVVDDCSPQVDVATLVKSIAGERVTVSKTTRNLGLAGCWNTCIERSRGHWVHILHQDDSVLPGFYEVLARGAERHPEVGLLATRSYGLDAAGIVEPATARLREWEDGGRSVAPFFYSNPVLCPGVLVKRSVYESLGGFRSDLKYALDYEMWARAIGLAGGWATPEILSCYRMSDQNETSRLTRSGENIRDLVRLASLFRERFPEFDCTRFKRGLSEGAYIQRERFRRLGDTEAYEANNAVWCSLTPAPLRAVRHLKTWANQLIQAVK